MRLGAASGAELYAVQEDDRSVRVEAMPRVGEGLGAFVDPALRRRSRQGRGLRRQRRSRRRCARGARYRVPFSRLRSEFQVQALQALFPRRRPRRRRAGAIAWWLAPALSRRTCGASPISSPGKARTSAELRGANLLADERLEPRPGGPRSRVPCCGRRSRAPCRCRIRSASPLTYEHDEQGDYAVYRLERARRSTRASWCASPAASTPRTSTRWRRRSPSAAGSPTSPTFRSAIRSGSRSRTSPPEYLPEATRGRQDYERELAESASYVNQVRSSDLEGVTVILDAGHGGRDGGAIVEGVWESIYVYDIVLRVRRLLETQTAAQTVVTTRDGGEWTVTRARRPRRLARPRRPDHAALPDRRPRGRRQPALVPREQRLRQGGRRAAAIRPGGLHLRPRRLAPPLGARRDGLRPGPPAPEPTYGKTGSVYTRGARSRSSRGSTSRTPSAPAAKGCRATSPGTCRRLRRAACRSTPEAGARPHHPQQARVGAGGAALQRGARQDPARGLQPRQRRRPRLIQTRAFREEVARSVVEGLLAYYGVKPEPPDGQVASKSAAG